ncbi:MAG: ribosomal RNA small subunit methyltransferase A [Deltaproteobacteria bacterium]|nr:ribosomal RNA small subunit methyltransferase A [Deltaproteobacteria bacterium]
MSLPSPQNILRRLGLKPKKSLGQHFLIHTHQARRIIQALALTPQDTVVEIGPGLGALTVLLAEQAREVVALEVDRTLAAYLSRELFAATPKVRIIQEDVLKFDLLRLCRETGQPLKLVGNLPYHITSPLLFKLMEEKEALSLAVLMVQEEVGHRLLAGPGSRDYGILSILAQYHFCLSRLFSLGPGNFYPSPQVNSVVLKLEPASPEPRAWDEGTLHRVVKLAFSRRRKTLKNTLAGQAAALGLSPEQALDLMLEAGIDPGHRAETLEVAQFVDLSNRIQAKVAEKRGG